MTAMTKPTASQVWRRIVDEAGDDEIAAILSLSQEEVDAELAGAGFDVQTERAKADQFLEDLVSGALEEMMGLGTAAPAPRAQPTSGIVAIAQPQQAPVLARPRRRPRTSMVLLFAAIAAAAAGGATYVTLHHGAPSPSPPAPEPHPEPSPSPSFVPPQPDLVAAADWRNKAIGACDARKWEECLADLDIARAIDPDGDDTPAVKATRDRAIQGIVGKPPKPTPDKPPVP
jgi:hypothetical protein